MVSRWYGCREHTYFRYTKIAKCVPYPDAIFLSWPKSIIVRIFFSLFFLFLRKEERRKNKKINKTPEKICSHKTQLGNSNEIPFRFTMASNIKHSPATARIILLAAVYCCRANCDIFLCLIWCRRWYQLCILSSSSRNFITRHMR